MSSFFTTSVREQAIQKLLPKLAGRQVLLAKGQCSCRLGMRIGVMTVAGSRAKLLWSGHVCKDEHVLLRAELASVARETMDGGIDFYHATPWSLAWTCLPAPFRLFSRWSGLRCSIVDGRIELRRRLFAPPIRELRISTADVDHVCVSIGERWTTQSLVIALKDGSTHTIAENRSIGPMIDPTYDGIDLLGDALWAESLGRALATALSTVLKLDEALGGGEWSPGTPGD